MAKDQKPAVYNLQYMRDQGLLEEARKVTDFLDTPLHVTAIDIKPNFSDKFGTKTSFSVIILETKEEKELFCFSMFLESKAMAIQKHNLFPFECSFTQSGDSLTMV
jgi:hypothetical protein